MKKKIPLKVPGVRREHGVKGDDLTSPASYVCYSIFVSSRIFPSDFRSLPPSVLQSHKSRRKPRTSNITQWQAVLAKALVKPDAEG
jgi:hypothetical protein